jgi:hypothetical protein
VEKLSSVLRAIRAPSEPKTDPVKIFREFVDHLGRIEKTKPRKKARPARRGKR